MEKGEPFFHINLDGVLLLKNGHGSEGTAARLRSILSILRPITRMQGVRKEEMAGETMSRSIFPKFSERAKASVDKGCVDMKELFFLFFSA